MTIPNKTYKKGVTNNCGDSCKLNKDVITRIISDKVSSDIPVIFGVDFGHIFPMITFPIGGKVKLDINKNHFDITLLNED